MKRVWTQIDPPKINVAGSCACIHTTAAGSDSSRRFCSVTAVVCRRFSHMTAEGGGGCVPPPSRFWGKMAAVALLLVPMVHVNQCEQETHWKHGDASTVTRTRRCVCRVSRRDECHTNAFTSVALLRCYPSVLCCGGNLRVWLFLEWSACFWEARMSRFVRFVCARWGNCSVLQAKTKMFHSFLKYWNYQVNKGDFISFICCFYGRSNKLLYFNHAAIDKPDILSPQTQHAI